MWGMKWSRVSYGQHFGKVLLYERILYIIYVGGEGGRQVVFARGYNGSGGRCGISFSLTATVPLIETYILQYNNNMP